MYRSLELVLSKVKAPLLFSSSSPSPPPPQELSEDDVTALQKQLHQQETLLNGYQQENERLYKELKDKSQDMKKIEGKMFEENQKLGKLILCCV